MSLCKHKTLVLLSGENNKLRCRSCHLTISIDELGGGYCPECYEVNRVKCYDFEELISKDDEGASYRCEECGVIINYKERPCNVGVDKE
jgi:predicted RNA-binding Zn-ribbon protein involved in translation (DUF1610 family)